MALTPENSRRRALPITGAVIALLALSLGVLCTVQVVLQVGRPLGQTFSNPVRQAPVDVSVVLEHEKYVLFEQTGRTSGGTSGGTGTTITTSHPVTLLPGEVTVRGPDGQRVAIAELIGGSQTLTRNNTVFTGAVLFVPPVAGTYHVQVSTSQPTAFILAPSLGTGFGRAWPWILGGLLSGLFLLLGIVLFVVGLVRRRSRPSRPFPAGPGWSGPA